MRARAFIEERVRPQLPKGWRYFDYPIDPDILDGPALVVATSGIERLAQAPMGSYDQTVTLTLVSANADFEQAEDELEDTLGTLIGLIEDHLQLPWEPASKVLYRERYLAWEVPVRVVTSREG